MINDLTSQYFVDSQEKDDLFDEAVAIIQKSKIASSSYLQRSLKLGYARAARLLDQLEQYGYVGPGRGAKPREVFESQIFPTPKKEVPVEEIKAKWNKTKYADNQTGDFLIDIGTDNYKKPIGINLDIYGNIFIIGSQFTSAPILLNNILATSIAKFSPDQLNLVVLDGIKGDLIVPNNAPHLLVPVITESEKAISALKWSIVEIERRLKADKPIYSPRILILINSLNQFLNFSPTEFEENLYRIMLLGRKCGVYLIVGTDFINPKTYKGIIANNPVKIVFKTIDPKIASDTGIPESINLKFSDEAIIEEMYLLFKRKVIIGQLDPEKIYKEIFE